MKTVAKRAAREKSRAEGGSGWVSLLTAQTRPSWRRSWPAPAPRSNERDILRASRRCRRPGSAPLTRAILPACRRLRCSPALLPCYCFFRPPALPLPYFRRHSRAAPARHRAKRGRPALPLLLACLALGNRRSGFPRAASAWPPLPDLCCVEPVLIPHISSLCKFPALYNMIATL